MAAILDLSAFAKAHEAVARPALAVAGGAEAGDIAQIHQPFHDFIQCAVIADIKLCGIILLCFFFIIAADTRAGAAADLGYPKTQYTFSAFLTFSGGNNHARIGNGNTDAGNDFCKGIIINAVIEGGGVNIVGMADSAVR